MLIFAELYDKFIITDYESKFSQTPGSEMEEVLPQTDIQFIDLGDSLHQDERGFVLFPFQNVPTSLPMDEMCSSCHVISIEPGQSRGNHQHPGKTEWLYVFHGSGRFYWRSGKGSMQQRVLNSSRIMVIIPPGTPHALRNEGNDPLYLLAWRAALEPGLDKPDTVPEYLI